MHRKLLHDLGAIVIVLVLSAQAAAGAWHFAVAAWRDRGVSMASRLGGDTDARLERSLGADAAIARALRDNARPGEWVLTRLVVGDAFTAAGELLAARLTSLRHATFPEPFLVSAGSEPVAVAEQAVPNHGSALILTLAGDPEPTGRPGWQPAFAGVGFALWRLQR